MYEAHEAIMVGELHTNNNLRRALAYVQAERDRLQKENDDLKQEIARLQEGA